MLRVLQRLTTAPKYFALRRRYPRRAARRGWAAEWAHGAAFAGMTLMRCIQESPQMLSGTMRPGAAKTKQGRVGESGTHLIPSS